MSTSFTRLRSASRPGYTLMKLIITSGVFAIVALIVLFSTLGGALQKQYFGDAWLLLPSMNPLRKY